MGGDLAVASVRVREQATGNTGVTVFQLPRQAATSIVFFDEYIPGLRL
jgi:hypothetical protein